jgi:hypothetical protein
VNLPPSSALLSGLLVPFFELSGLGDVPDTGDDGVLRLRGVELDEFQTDTSVGAGDYWEEEMGSDGSDEVNRGDVYIANDDSFETDVDDCNGHDDDVSGGLARWSREWSKQKIGDLLKMTVF